MSSYIEIGNCIFKQQVNEVSIYSSWKYNTDTAEIKLPNLPVVGDVFDGTKEQFERVAKVGDTALIKLGYDDDFNTEFEGYVVKIIPGSPVEIFCEDEMWKLK